VSTTVGGHDFVLASGNAARLPGQGDIRLERRTGLPLHHFQDACIIMALLWAIWQQVSRCLEAGVLQTQQQLGESVHGGHPCSLQHVTPKGHGLSTNPMKVPKKGLVLYTVRMRCTER
jgi:hypothetical protein